MPQILNFSEHANDEEVSYLTTLLLYHLVERCGGQIQFTVSDVNQIRENLSTKMVQIQLGDDVRLRIIDRVPELRDNPSNFRRAIFSRRLLVKDRFPQNTSVNSHLKTTLNALWWRHLYGLANILNEERHMWHHAPFLLAGFFS